jgi:peptidyl-prolyl cis-trans isomerase SurA
VVAARHVLIQYKGAERSEATRTKEEAKARAEQVLKLARSTGTDFGSLAKYSDEPAAEARGGSLGVFGRGQMTPKFEEVTFGLGEGQVSDVVETEFGFHVIQREPVYALAVIPVLFKGEKAPPSVTRTKEEAAARANEAVTKLRGGLVLSEAVKTYSDEPNANMGLVQVQLTSDSMLPPPVREKVTGVALNGIADPVEVPIGYFVIQKQPLLWADAAHILVRYKGALGAEEDATITRSKDDAKKLADQVLTEAKAAGADFAALAKKYSDDAGSKEKGGSLGTVFTGNDVSSIVDPVVVLKVGDLSGVVETPFGFHIFKRLEAAPPAPPAPMVLPGVPGGSGTPPGHP